MNIAIDGKTATIIAALMMLAGAAWWWSSRTTEDPKVTACRQTCRHLENVYRTGAEGDERPLNDTEQKAISGCPAACASEDWSTPVHNCMVGQIEVRAMERCRSGAPLRQ